MSTSPDDPDADKVVHLGPIEVGLRKRREPIRAYQEFHAAMVALFDAVVRATGIERLVGWVDKRAPRNRGQGEQ